jgi:hypothetical protein
MRPPTGTGAAWLATHRKLNQWRYVWWNIRTCSEGWDEKDM